ncbi:MAG: T9SS type A sorting domain-containing protein [bacterium]
MKKIIYIILFIILSRSITGAQEPICILPNSAQGIIVENQYKPIQDIQLYKVETNSLQSMNNVPVFSQKNLIEQIYSGQTTEVQKVNTSHTIYDGKYTVYKINTDTKSIEKVLPSYEATGKCKQALTETPEWLRKDLAINLELLGSKADDFADLILGAETKLKDEIAFQIANLSIQSLTNSRFLKSINLLKQNAEMIYEIAPQLKYVRLKEYSDYTTTEYKIKKGTGYIWKEIPRDIYYWYLVMPKLYQEGLWSDDDVNSTQQRTYGYFWRDYIWNNPDPTHDYTNVNIKTQVGEIKTILVFKDMMVNSEYLWDGDKSAKLFGREIANTDGALDMLCNWASRAIPIDAEAGKARAIHPCQILYQHRGNCGEDSYLITAAARTALIPACYQGTMREDHVWGGFWDGGWQHYEFFRGGLVQSGWGWTSFDPKLYETLAPDYWLMSIIQGWRADGWQFNNTEPYTYTCNVKLTIVDKATNIPIPDLQVMIYASPGHPGDNNVAYSGTFYTGKNGIVEFKAGDAKYYYVQVYNKTLGYAPGETNVFRINTDLSQGNAEYTGVVPIETYKIPSANYQKLQAPETSNYGLQVKFQSDEIISNESRYDSQKSRFKKWADSASGSVDIFLVDQINYNKFKGSIAFSAYFPYTKVNKADILFAIPEDSQEWYFVISNKNSFSNYEYIDGEISLVEGEIKGIDGKIDDEDVSGQSCKDFILLDNITVSPNPASDFIDVNLNPSNSGFIANKTIEIYSSLGILVQKTNFDTYLSNNNIKIDISKLGSGVYYLKFDGCYEAKQFVIVK